VFQTIVPLMKRNSGFTVTVGQLPLTVQPGVLAYFPIKPVVLGLMLFLFFGSSLRGQISQSALPEAPSPSILKSKSFLLPHASMFLSIGFDGEMSRELDGYSCHEGNSRFRSSTGEFQASKYYAFNLSLAAGLTAIDYLLRRSFPRNRWIKGATIAAPLAVPFGTAQHIDGGVGWVKCI
jgi:hypothetical protein